MSGGTAGTSIGYFVYATPLILVGLEAEIAKAGLLAVLDCFV